MIFLLCLTNWIKIKPKSGKNRRSTLEKWLLKKLYKARKQRLMESNLILPGSWQLPWLTMMNLIKIKDINKIINMIINKIINKKTNKNRSNMNIHNKLRRRVRSSRSHYRKNRSRLLYKKDQAFVLIKQQLLLNKMMLRCNHSLKTNQWLQLRLRLDLRLNNRN